MSDPKEPTKSEDEGTELPPVPPPKPDPKLITYIERGKKPERSSKTETRERLKRR